MKTMRSWNNRITLNYLQIFVRLLVSILTKTSENGHHVWGAVIYREFNTNMTILVEIESKRTYLDFV